MNNTVLDVGGRGFEPGGGFYQSYLDDRRSCEAEWIVNIEGKIIL
jgi:hypothetical protein